MELYGLLWEKLSYSLSPKIQSEILKSLNKNGAYEFLIYNPMETKLLSYGKESNKQIVDGLYMLVGQAVKAQEIWQDTVIDDSVIENIYRKIKINLILS